MKLQAARIFIQKSLRYRCFPVNFVKVFRTLIVEYLWGLLVRLTFLRGNEINYFRPRQEKSKSERLGSWRFFVEKFLKLEVNISSKSLPKVLNSLHVISLVPSHHDYCSTISTQWTELVSSNCILYSRSVDKGSSEHICNISGIQI